MPDTWKIAAFYRFTVIGNPDALADALRRRGDALSIMGTVILAGEGINGTVAGADDTLDLFLKHVQSETGIPDQDIKISWSSIQPFRRFKVKRKKEIVTFRHPDIDPSRPEITGDYVDPSQWNALVRDPEVTLIDTRNDYEVRVGHFPGALNPGTEDFTAFADWVKANLDPERHEKVAMYCTGGIRCEKATAFLKQEGFRQVAHLRGGILKYLEETTPEQNLWEGDCFVFDERVAVDTALQPAGWQLCPRCHQPFRDACSCERGTG